VAIAAIAGAAGGCGGSAPARAREQQLQRADLVTVSSALRSVEPSVRGEVAATGAAWPLVANGLPADVSPLRRGPIRNAVVRAANVRLPVLFAERSSRSLTGPAAGVAGSFRAYSGLSARGWRMIEAAIAAQRGPHGAAAFARANSPLYIESVYDSHYSLAQIGKHLSAGYLKLGGARAFGASLTQAEVDQLAASYSEGNDRLHPHPGVKLGS
jgi:hypothetical protein